MIFVFGSNLSGRHGKGAALYARQHKGAIYGQGVGLQGSSYAIPTKDHNIRTMPIDQIEPYVKEFLMFADENLDMDFALTPIGCGLAGHKKVDMIKMIRLHYIPENVYFTRDWFKPYVETTKYPG